MNYATTDQIRAAFATEPPVRRNARCGSRFPGMGALPLSYDDEQLFWLDGHAKPANDSGMNWAVDYIVDPGYLNVMRIPLRSGRFFTPQDEEHTPLVAVVDDVFARQYFRGEDPIGKRIVLNTSERKLEIIGVVNHVKQWGLDLDDTNSLRAQLYIPCMQMPDDFIAMEKGSQMVVRYHGELARALDAIRATNRNISNQQVIYNDQTMESIVAESIASRRFAMILLERSPHSRSSWRALASTGSSRMSSASARTKCEFAWRSARSAGMCSGWCYGREQDSRCSASLSVLRQPLRSRISWQTCSMASVQPIH